MNLSVVIPTLNAATTLPRTVACVRTADEVIVSDGGSIDGTCELASDLGARVITGPRGRGSQLAAGAEASRGDWLLFLHADTVLETGWEEAVEAHIANSASRGQAAAFRFALDDTSAPARRLEKLVAWRVAAMGLPYGDQGLLIAREFYLALGGFRNLPLMEDVDLVRRIGRRRLVTLPVKARTSAARWQRDGWIRRSARNATCLSLYIVGVSPRLLHRLYG